MRYSPAPFERLLTRFIASQVARIEELFNQFVDDATRRTLMVNPPKDKDFFFKDYPALNRQINTMLKGLSSRWTKTIETGDEWGWDLANVKNDNMLSKVLGSIGKELIPAAALERWNQKNLPALAAFENRRIGGMKLSDKVWKYTKDMKGDLELALDLGIGEGASADRLSRMVRQYLKEPERLYRRVRDEKGVLRLSKSAANYHPGQGVYRSAYKNARRLTATENNMAYRTADNERMNQIPFILGYEVHLSNNHTCLDSHGVPQPFYDICDELQGKYPKWFIFTGWHPLCRCYVTTILPDQDEFIKYLAAMNENGVSSYKFKGEVTDMPQQFKEWLKDNKDRIEAAQERGKLPYFLKENPKAWKGASESSSGELSTRKLTDDEVAEIKRKAYERHKARTPAEIRAIQDRWDERVYGKDYVNYVHNVEQWLGVQRGKRMTHEEANYGKVNPNYGKRGYSTNCSTCSGVYILRRMGFDVSAKSNWGENSVWWFSQGENTWAKWKGGKSTYIKTYDWMSKQGFSHMGPLEYKKFIDEVTAKPGIYEFNVGWSDKSSGGHSTLLWRMDSGQIVRIDQQDYTISISVQELYKRLQKNPPTATRGIMRVDNALPSRDFMGAVKVNKPTKKKRLKSS